jgi:hypothetical protein
MNRMGGTIGTGGDCPVERASEVSMVLSELNSVIQRHDSLVTRLSSRLSCVTTSAPAVCNETTKDVQYQTDLANHINSMRMQARNVADNLESILDRIEL